MAELLKDYFESDNHVVLPGDIRWVKSVDSLEKLEVTLNDSDIDIIEVDVSLSEQGIPIAAHPPIAESDLAIMTLLERLATTTQGLKLDFKETACVIPVLKRIAAKPLDQPVFLNADVLNTDDARKARIDPDWFIDVCAKYYPHGILSLGWRTSGKPGSVYSAEKVDEMINLCRNLETVTFPVRATMLPGSWENIKKLTEQENRTLTIWNTGPLDDNLKKWVKENTKPAYCFYSVDLSEPY